MELKRRKVEAELLDPSHRFRPVRAVVEVRWDPLTGQTSRLLAPRDLLPPGVREPEEVGTADREDCPFCPERLETHTPRFPPVIWPEGRIRRGRAVLFPNLHPYAAHSSVSVYSPQLHVLRLEDLGPDLMADNLAAQLTFLRAVREADPGAGWGSVNANHLPPSGSSVFHPHLQGLVDREPTTMQRLLAACRPEAFAEYVETERRLGERSVGRVGEWEWVASFAPLGPAELRAFRFGRSSLLELDEADVEALARGISAALSLYAAMGLQSFNLALYGSPPGPRAFPPNLRIAARSGLAPFYRSDATFLERLHWEAAVDVAPEEVAARAREVFPGS